MKSWTTTILWGVYIGLLAALLPHTAWAFRQFEPSDSSALIGSFTWADLVSYTVAFAFESAIAALTHKLSKHIEDRSRKLGRKSRWEKFEAFYLNPFALGLIVATAVSALANYAHAVEFGKAMQVFGASPFWRTVYSVAFGGALPFVSLIFARVLSNVVETEQDEDPAFVEAKTELRKANSTVRSLQETIRQAEQQANATEQLHQDAIRQIEQQANATEQLHQDAIRQIEQQANATEQQYQAAIRQIEHLLEESEQRYRAVGDVVRFLFGTDLALRDRVRGIRTQFPNLSQNGIAQLLGCSVSTVNTALDGYIAEIPEIIEVQP